jgi:RNase P/RNase MRP subunit POP5
MWNVKAKVIPAITGATGTIVKAFRKYLSNIQGK